MNIFVIRMSFPIKTLFYLKKGAKKNAYKESKYSKFHAVNQIRLNPDLPKAQNFIKYFN